MLLRLGGGLMKGVEWTGTNATATDQGGRATQSDREVGFTRAIPSYKTVGAGQDICGRSARLHLLVGPTQLYIKQFVKKDGNEGGEQWGQPGIYVWLSPAPTFNSADLQKTLASCTRELPRSLSLGLNGKDPAGVQGLQVAAHSSKMTANEWHPMYNACGQPGFPRGRSAGPFQHASEHPARRTITHE